jgi:hypothetical protein
VLHNSGKPQQPRLKTQRSARDTLPQLPPPSPHSMPSQPLFKRQFPRLLLLAPIPCFPRRPQQPPLPSSLLLSTRWSFVAAGRVSLQTSSAAPFPPPFLTLQWQHRALKSRFTHRPFHRMCTSACDAAVASGVRLAAVFLLALHSTLSSRSSL